MHFPFPHARRLGVALLLGAGLLAGTAGLTGCGSDDDTSITIYSGRSESLVGPIFEAFTAETGIAVKARYGSSNDMALTLETEGSKTTADVFLSRSPGPTGYLNDLGMLADLDDDVLGEVHTANRSHGGTWVGFAGRARVLVYNIDEVPEDDLPDSVFDLTGPEYAGLVAIPGSNSSFQDWFTVFRLRNGDDGGLMIFATASVLDSSDDKDLANRFLAFLLSDAQQRYLTDSVFEYPLAIGVAPASQLPERPTDSVGAVDIDDMAAEFKRTIEIIEASGVLDQ